MGWSEIAIIVLVVVIVLLFLLNRAARPRSAPTPTATPTDSRPSVDPTTADVVTELVIAGRKIEAIKVLRQATGLKLKDAKDWVDEWNGGRSRPVAAPTPTTDSEPAYDVLVIEARAVRDASGPIAAIKHVRARTGWGLAEAKEYVERL